MSDFERKQTQRQKMADIRWAVAEDRRNQVIDLLRQGSTVEEAVAAIGLSVQAFRQWKKRDTLFAAEVESIITGARKFKEEDPNDWRSFVDFRKKFFGHETYPHMAMMTQAIESTQPGDITMILMPPEHAKTTTMEDYCCYRLALDPEHRITVGSEGQRLAEKMLGRIKNRMEPDGPYPTYVNQFGPFVPQKHGGRATRQVWAAAFFNVARRNASDERDYNMVALGFGGNIAGTRTDHLHVDDLQSRKSLNFTERMVETFQQDWLSRPGETGITTIAGTRVGDGDFYEALEDQYAGKSFFRVIKMPAIVRNPKTGEKEPLWKRDPNSKHKQKGYTLESLARIREKVGEDAWSRNYMQRPRAKSLGTFTEDIIDRCKNFDRVVGSATLPAPGSPILIGLDPALGGINCLMAIQITSGKLWILDVKEDQALSRNEQIMDRLEAMVVGLQARGGLVSDVVIEAMNFQRGLARDERLREMSEQYGFAIREHLCVDDQTEVLTEHGWQTHDQLEVGTRILTLDIEQDRTEWLPVDYVHRQAYDGPMYRFDSANLDALCTPDHRWPVRTQFDETLVMKEAQHLNTGHVVPLARPSSFDPPERFSDDLVELVAWCATEGHYRKGSSIRIGQSKSHNPELVKRIEALLERIGGPYRKVADRPNGMQVWALNGELGRSVRAITGDCADGKHIPPWFVLSLSRRQRELFIGTMVDADGWRRQGEEAFCSDDDSLLQAVEMAALLNGISVKRTYRKDRPHHGVVYLRRATNAYLQNRKVRPTVEQWSGTVWCPHTPNGTFLARRNGKVYVTGNTGVNKYDSDIGVASMARAFIKREVDIAYGDDEHTRDIADQLRYQLLRWTPGKRGTQLRQDQVMALWFVWCVWQARRRTVSTSSANFKADGLPWKPTESGLMIPTSASPFYKAG